MTDLVRKLQIKDGMRGRIFELPPGVDLDLPDSKTSVADFAIGFVSGRADIRRLAGPTVDCLKEDGILWFCYPKKSAGLNTDIHRDQGWEPLTDLGYRGVRMVSIDAVWSALRFRERRLVRAKNK